LLGSTAPRFRDPEAQPDAHQKRQPHPDRLEDQSEITEYPICYACECSSECPQAFLFSSAQIGSHLQWKLEVDMLCQTKTRNVQSGYFTQERIQGDLDYRRAQDIAKKMLDDGLISVAEFNKLTAINRETFSPLFAEIMPKIP
jgi:hypothetical protein